MELRFAFELHDIGILVYQLTGIRSQCPLRKFQESEIYVGLYEDNPHVVVQALITKKYGMALGRSWSDRRGSARGFWADDQSRM